jgi:hypothetical protein
LTSHLAKPCKRQGGKTLPVMLFPSDDITGQSYVLDGCMDGPATPTVTSDKSGHSIKAERAMQWLIGA